MEIDIELKDIPAALRMAHTVGNDNKFCVMVKGYSEDYDNFTGIYLTDYEEQDDEEILSCMDGYTAFQVWGV